MLRQASVILYRLTINLVSSTLFIKTAADKLDSGERIDGDAN